jgi:hypothetical protein
MSDGSDRPTISTPTFSESLSLFINPGPDTDIPFTTRDLSTVESPSSSTCSHFFNDI